MRMVFLAPALFVLFLIWTVYQTLFAVVDKAIEDPIGFGMKVVQIQQEHAERLREQKELEELENQNRENSFLWNLFFGEEDEHSVTIIR